jgi:YHS domain-containing protein
MRPFLLTVLVFLSLGLAGSAIAEDEVFSTPEGAIRGYDPVAYHTENRPVPGNRAFAHDWQGATWLFASAGNRDLFAKDPERYAPQYGGYCAYGTSQGYKVSTQPEAFSIVGGKLYLNYSLPVQQTWNADRPGYIALADANWAGLRNTPYKEGD